MAPGIAIATMCEVGVERTAENSFPVVPGSTFFLLPHGRTRHPGILGVAQVDAETRQISIRVPRPEWILVASVLLIAVAYLLSICRCQAAVWEFERVNGRIIRRH